LAQGFDPALGSGVEGLEITALSLESLATFVGDKDAGSAEHHDGTADKSTSSVLERVFQLSESFAWRVEPGELGGETTEVGFFASQELPLNAFGPNSSIKLDVGVNIEGKSEGKPGGAAGKAGVVVAW
jgi:hypothetical protein